MYGKRSVKSKKFRPKTKVDNENQNQFLLTLAPIYNVVLIKFQADVCQQLISSENM